MIKSAVFHSKKRFDSCLNHLSQGSLKIRPEQWLNCKQKSLKCFFSCCVGTKEPFLHCLDVNLENFKNYFYSYSEL